MLRRKMLDRLREWRSANASRAGGVRKAFLLDGPRQTGKTFVVRQLGREYRDFVEVNFLENGDAAALLRSCTNARELVSALSLLVGREVEPGAVLVFLDEVQEAPEAVVQAKFLAEDGRFDVALSGSLLGVELKDVRSFPVGYVEEATMRPLDFEEFARSQGAGDEVLGRVREAFEAKEPLEDALHARLVRLFRLYLAVGGMPEAVQRYVDSRYDLGAVREVQSQIVRQYRRDISKYARGRELQVRSIFDAMPSQLAQENKRFQLRTLREKATFERFANDFAWLVAAGVALKCDAVSEPAWPLRRTEDPRRFKLYSSDQGLLLSQYPAGVAAGVLEGARGVNFGAVYENAVAQELTAAGVPLRYFRSSRKGEVDFLVEDARGRVLPVEVKSGKDYKLHTALNNLLGTVSYGIEEAVVLSEANVSAGERSGKPVWYLPLYMAWLVAEGAAPGGEGAGRRAAALLSSVDAAPPAF